MNKWWVSGQSQKSKINSNRWLVNGLSLIGFFCMLSVSSCNMKPVQTTASGSAAPEFTLSDFNGTQYTLSQFKGKIVFLDFWASWCPPCRAASPIIAGLHARYQDKSDKVAVMGINLDTRNRQQAQDFIKEKSIPYLNLQGTEDVAQQYGVQGIPMFVIIDQNGAIVKQYVGMRSEYEAEWIERIDSLIQ